MRHLVQGFQRLLRLLGLVAGLALLLLALSRAHTVGKVSSLKGGGPTAPPAGTRGRVGILVGHLGSDSGAICPDGLREVDVNLRVATLVRLRLEARGYRVDLLQEFDPALRGYGAKVLLALHTDSCIEGFSGFKVTHAADSAIPQPEERLVECLLREYAQATGLGVHTGTITDDMRWYHAFYEVQPQTPAAILEMGFLREDQALLTHRSEVAAEGVTRGLLCFLEPASK